jgi:hypothetical protein
VQRSHIEMVGLIPLGNIFLVDDLGDGYNDPPHLLVIRDHQHGFFTKVRSPLELDGPTSIPKPLSGPSSILTRFPM